VPQIDSLGLHLSMYEVDVGQRQEGAVMPGNSLCVTLMTSHAIAT